MTTKSLTLSVAFLFAAATAICQHKPLIVASNLHLPADTAENRILVRSLDGFLTGSVKPHKENGYVWNSRLPATAALLDEQKGLDTAGAYLDNVVPVDSGRLTVQFSYITVKAGTPSLLGSFKLLAMKTGDHYSFYSPLEENTRTWKTKKMGRFMFYYRYALNKELSKNYVNKAAEFDRKLNAPDYLTRVYFCDDAPEALELLGVTYKAAYNGREHENFFAFENNESLMVFGTNSSDPEALDIHDCWHTRLYYSPKPGVVNRFIDEGCAYLYGGSWGLSWSYILNRFRTVMADKKDWLAVYTENKQFGDSDEKHLYAAYVINALLVQKIEKEKGFPAVMQFLCSGKKQKDDANYFEALDRIDGINRSNFNAVIEKLLNN
jgi:hypothetical protein